MAPLPCEYVQTTPKADASVIWLHGLGADGHDFKTAVPQLALPGSLAARFIFPHAPYRNISCYGGAAMRAWYDIFSLQDLHDHAGLSSLAESTAQIHALIDKEVETGIASDRIVLAGFSQGGAMVYHAGLRYPKRLAGLVALSAYLPQQSLVPNETTLTQQNTPLFIAHGQFDSIVPLALGKAAYEQFQRWGMPAVWERYPIDHAVSSEELKAVGCFLADCLNHTGT